MIIEVYYETRRSRIPAIFVTATETLTAQGLAQKTNLGKNNPAN